LTKRFGGCLSYRNITGEKTVKKSIVKTMNQSISRFFGRLSTIFGGEEAQEVALRQPESQQVTEVKEKQSVVESKQAVILQSQELDKEIKPESIKIKKINKKQSNNLRNKIIREPTEFIKDPRDIRDVMELMEIPFVALSKHRTAPIIYESHDGKSKVKISRHTEHYIPSIYDWDIILFVSSKLQETINSKSDIPPRTLIVPKNELIKSIYRHSGKTTDNEIEAALNRLRSALIETTIHNEDYRYRGGFGFLDSWGYTERKDIKEFRITLSEWLYSITCSKGALLKVHPEYFKITSGIKRFLYRTARKHVGIQNESWIFSIETLYKKSGSEQELRKFKHDLKKSIKDNNTPGYFLEWIDDDGKISIRFINIRKDIKKALLPPNEQPKP
jgi:predicted RNA-binding protein with PIN domain